MKNSMIILASGSPRRIEMMEQHGITPAIIKPECDEELPDGIKGEDAVMFLSLKKALDVEARIKQWALDASETAAGTADADGLAKAENATVGENVLSTQAVENAGGVQAVKKAGGAQDLNNADLCRKYLENGAYIIAADTIVYKDEIIGKPRDREDARRILGELNGKEHYVITGVSILRCGRPERRTFAETTKVYFKKYSMEELEAYIKSDEPYDKAGGYAIQGTFGKYIDHIDGDMNNVIGFPWDRITEEFGKLSK